MGHRRRSWDFYICAVMARAMVAQTCSTFTAGATVSSRVFGGTKPAATPTDVAWKRLRSGIRRLQWSCLAGARLRQWFLPARRNTWWKIWHPPLLGSMAASSQRNQWSTSPSHWATWKTGNPRSGSTDLRWSVLRIRTIRVTIVHSASTRCGFRNRNQSPVVLVRACRNSIPWCHRTVVDTQHPQLVSSL